MIAILNPGERAPGIDDERDHNTMSDDDMDMSFGYLSLNLNGQVNLKPSHSWSHVPKTFKVWRDHSNLGVSDSRVDKARALIALDKLNTVLSEKQRLLINELVSTKELCKFVSLALATVHDT